ncbi:hypothetical protein ACFLIN_07635 [Corynebacterium kutscheri]|uniref:hypothetical protein n=1 Tax=Corynebacterium kutscheri TaxID=35755 RepID=UPI000F81935D|nr:hypothetical protein [Corynebacterium kutscheri]
MANPTCWGRKGRTPAWPLSGRAPAGWVALWRKPQAVMWEKNGDDFLVARYLILRNLTEDPEEASSANAALLGEVRQLEDRLGLSPMAMKRLQWEIEDIQPVLVSDDVRVVDARERFGKL